VNDEELKKRGVDWTDVVQLGEAKMQSDKLENMFKRQKELMDQLVMSDKLPEYPIDISSKHGQRQIKELTWAMVEEMAEASYILKNRSHRFTDHTDVDFAHFKEELADALAYCIEICVFAGISHNELFEEYCIKNAVVKKRVKDGY
jgi:NTP pyrophosphatase (non-canonical NTP hydrolase)